MLVYHNIFRGPKFKLDSNITIDLVTDYGFLPDYNSPQLQNLFEEHSGKLVHALSSSTHQVGHNNSHNVHALQQIWAFLPFLSEGSKRRGEIFEDTKLKSIITDSVIVTTAKTRHYKCVSVIFALDSFFKVDNLRIPKS